MYCSAIACMCYYSLVDTRARSLCAPCNVRQSALHCVWNVYTLYEIFDETFMNDVLFITTPFFCHIIWRHFCIFFSSGFISNRHIYKRNVWLISVFPLVGFFALFCVLDWCFCVLFRAMHFFFHSKLYLEWQFMWHRFVHTWNCVQWLLNLHNKGTHHWFSNFFGQDLYGHCCPCSYNFNTNLNSFVQPIEITTENWSEQNWNGIRTSIW